MTSESGDNRRQWLIRGGVFGFLLLLVVVLGSLNVSVLEPGDPSEMILLYVFSTLVFLAFVGYGLTLIRYLVRLHAERRRGVLGSKFKTRMVAGALALSLLPSLALFFLSYALVNRTLAKWFPRPLEIVRDDALAMIQHILLDHELQAMEQAEAIASNDSLAKAARDGDTPELRSIFEAVAAKSAAAWIAVTSPNGELVALWPPNRAGPELSGILERLGTEARQQSQTATEHAGEQVYSVARTQLTDDSGYLILGRPLEASLLKMKAEIESESANYAAIHRSRKAYRWQALLILLLVTTLVLLASTWLALFLAKEVTLPIQALAEATEQISRGNLSHRVVTPARDELATLVASFNSMTRQLEESRRVREEVLAELDERRRWMETLLESLPTGVLTLSPDRWLLQSNSAAAALLDQEPRARMVLGELLPPEAKKQCEELLRSAETGGMVSAQVDIPLRDRVAHVAVTAAALRRGAERQGYVLVLDDLSDLLKAQKAAAWQEVAQRIAHEIKNPLTPIQLSADRIRGYMEKLPASQRKDEKEYREKILQCAATIGGEVHSLKTLVDEFSEFARFPALRPAPTDLNHLVKDTVELYGQNGEFDLHCDLGDDLPRIEGDGELLRRVISNLLQNASDALQDSGNGGNGTKKIQIETRFAEAAGMVILTVADTGSGILPEHKEGLFLPFFSTKENGTGLGLAIAGRVVSEHGGRIRVEGNEPRGTRFIVELPVELPMAGRPAKSQGQTA